MISVMTNEGALEFGRALSGGSRFLAWEAALLADGFDGMSVKDVALLDHDSVNLSAGLISGKQVVKEFDCTGSLPVKVSVTDDVTDAAMAVDFDFNGQVPIDGGVVTDIQYKAVVALGRRYYKYMYLENNTAYKEGDHVWGDGNRGTAYICLSTFTYTGVPPEDDTEHWGAIDAASLITYPGERDFFCNPAGDIIPFFITSYDNMVTMSNGMEWEYKVRVFLDNVVTTQLSRLGYFSQGGLEANGSLMLTFMASISEQFRTIRDLVSTAG